MEGQSPGWFVLIYVVKGIVTSEFVMCSKPDVF